MDDNFIGNQRNVKRLLRELDPRMAACNYPFTFITEASSTWRTMLKCWSHGPSWLLRRLLGIETPDEDSLKVTRKLQNTRSPLVEACHKINQAGLLIYAGFILGFDGEQAGAGERIQAFVEVTSIPQPMLGVLQALPNTALWQRLQREARLHHADGVGAVEVGDETL